MRKFVIIGLSLLVLAALIAIPCFAYTVPGDTLVYVTPSGEKYHRKECTYTGSTAVSMTIETAELRGYTPCSRCDPDERTGEYVSTWDGDSGGSGSGDSSGRDHAGTSASVSSLPGFLQFLLGIAICGAFTLLLCLPFLIHGGIKKRKERKARDLRFAEEKARYTELYGGQSPEKLSGMPGNVEIGPDRLPKITGCSDWGKPFTFYVTSNGCAYHRTCGCSGARIPEHAVNCTWRPPCRVCWPELPDLSWYEKYCKIKAIKNEYNID